MTGSPIFFPIILTNRIGPLGGANGMVSMELRTRIRVIGVNFSDFLIKGKIEILVRVGGNSSYRNLSRSSEKKGREVR